MVSFLDTYAIIEIAIDNPNYRKYVLEHDEAITTIFNLAEVHFYYLKHYGQKEADKIYEIVRKFLAPIDEFILKEANNFKLIHLKKRFSFADCVGYVTSLKFRLKFVTGDYAFKGFANVEYVR